MEGRLAEDVSWPDENHVQDQAHIHTKDSIRRFSFRVGGNVQLVCDLGYIHERINWSLQNLIDYGSKMLGWNYLHPKPHFSFPLLFFFRPLSAGLDDYSVSLNKIIACGQVCTSCLFDNCFPHLPSPATGCIHTGVPSMRYSCLHFYQISLYFIYSPEKYLWGFSAI